MTFKSSLAVRSCAVVLAGTAALGSFFGLSKLAESKNRTNMTVMKPDKSDELLNNPYMGFAPDAEGGPYSIPHRLVYANMTWRELEPVKGQYRFEELEKKIGLEDWVKQGKKLILRVVLDTPKSSFHMDIPDWLYEETGHDGTPYDVDIGKGFSPNYMNPLLLEEHQKLIHALGERYNRDSRIAFIELGSLGHWGEWHTWQDDQLTIPFPRSEVSDTYVSHYLSAFPDKILLMRRPYGIARDHKLGLFNDMFGNEEHTREGFLKWFTEGYTFWLTDENIPGMPDFWVYAPSGGELADSGEGDKYFRPGIFSATLAQARDTHVSWLGPSAPVNKRYSAAVEENIEQFLKTIGYRFRLDSVAYDSSALPGSSLRMRMIWVNEGVAPFYFNWSLELSLSDASGSIRSSAIANVDIRTWLPGSHTTVADLPLPAGLDEGEYSVCVSVLDPDTHKPGLEFAMKGKRQDGRYAVGRISIKK